MRTIWHDFWAGEPVIVERHDRFGERCCSVCDEIHIDEETDEETLPVPVVLPVGDGIQVWLCIQCLECEAWKR